MAMVYKESYLQMVNEPQTGLTLPTSVAEGGGETRSLHSVPGAKLSASKMLSVLKMPLTRPYCCDNCRGFRPTIARSHLLWLLQYASTPQPTAISSPGPCPHLCQACTSPVWDHKLCSEVLQKGANVESQLQAVPEVPVHAQQAPHWLVVALSVRQLVHNTDKVVVGDGELTVLPSPVLEGHGWWAGWKRWLSGSISMAHAWCCQRDHFQSCTVSSCFARVSTMDAACSMNHRICLPK